VVVASSPLVACRSCGGTGSGPIGVAADDADVPPSTNPFTACTLNSYSAPLTSMLAVHGGETGYGSLCRDSPWLALRIQMYAPVECAVGVQSRVACPSPELTVRSPGAFGAGPLGTTDARLDMLPTTSPLTDCTLNSYLAPLTSMLAVHGGETGYGSLC